MRGLFFRLIFLFVSLASVSGYAQETHPIWKITSKTNSVYLMGSIHAMKADHYPLDPAFESTFDKAQHLVTEVDVDSLALEEVMRALISRGTYADGTTLSQHIPPGVFEQVGKMAASVGLSPQLLQPLRPWLVSLTLTSVYLQTKGFLAENGLDQYFYTRAKGLYKSRQALETISFQTNLLADMSDSVQTRLLVQTLEDFDQADTTLDDLYQAWKTGNTASLEHLLSETYTDSPDLYHRLFLDRNLRWVPQIEQLLTGTDTYLVIVGAAHLVGKEGVVELLRAKGYTVEQL